MEDIRSIILKIPEFDLGYIEKWLAEFDASLEGNYLESFKKILYGLEK
jgi:hypothetical protein